MKTNFIAALKNILLVICITIPGMLSAQASTVSPQKVRDALENYQRNINHENDGVAVSSIVNIIRIRFLYPGEDYRKIITRLTDVLVKSDNPRLQYHAFVALHYLKKPLPADWQKTPAGADQSKLLEELTLEIEKQLQSVGQISSILDGNQTK